MPPRAMQRLVLLAASAALCTGLQAQTARAEGKIGYVSTERILRDSAPAARA